MATYWMPFVNMEPHELTANNQAGSEWHYEDLLAAAGFSRGEMDAILSNRLPITLDSAQSLSGVFGPSAKYWFLLDVDYRRRSQNKS